MRHPIHVFRRVRNPIHRDRPPAAFSLDDAEWVNRRLQRVDINPPYLMPSGGEGLYQHEMGLADHQGPA